MDEVVKRGCTRFAALVGTLAVAALLAACGGNTNPATGTVLIQRSGGPPALLPPHAEPFDLARVPDDFTAALEAYARQVRRAEIAAPADRSAEVHAALRLLSGALRTVPRAPAETAAAADAIRAAEARMAYAIASPKDVRSLVDALRAAATGLRQAARGPYRDVPEVAQRARAFEEQVGVFGERSARSLRPPLDDAVRALHAGALVLTAMHTSIALGRLP